MSIQHTIGDLELKVFDINAHSLRGLSFYKSIVDYRKEIILKYKHLNKKDKDFSCILCGHKIGDQFLEWKEAEYKLFRCRSCDAVSPNISSCDDIYTESVYDTDVYVDKFMRETHAQYEYRKNKFGKERYKYTIDRLNLGKGSKVLDIGCGAGYYIDVLKDNAIEYKGLEVADHFVEYCKSYHNLNVENSSLENEKNEEYDLITMFDVLEHLTDPVDVFHTIHKKLKPGGHCVAYTPNIFSMGYELMGAKQNTLLPFEHLCFFNKKSLGYLTEKTGFIVEKLEVRGLDIMDYLLLKEHEDGFNYTDKLQDLMNLLQAVLDKNKIGNHLRITFQKSF
jgi:2-polyprenyl-3-methyl-5-hydroxy-6-metoxy-1,4-benzoquinol methylase